MRSYARHQESQAANTVLAADIMANGERGMNEEKADSYRRNNGVYVVPAGCLNNEIKEVLRRQIYFRWKMEAPDTE